MADEKQKIKHEREEFAGLDADGLKARLDEEKKRLWTLKFAQGKRQLENTADLAKTKKRIARINMYLRALELQETK